jgi:hypothetical protein
MYSKAFGSKFDKSLDVKEIAKLLRKDLKAYVNANDLSGLKVSTKIDRFSGGQSIDMLIVALPDGIELVNPDWNQNYRISKWSEKVTQILEDIKEMHKSYNYDGSNSMFDYFSVNYYGQVGIDWKLESNSLKEVN